MAATPPTVLFAFGPDSSFFLYCPTKTIYHDPHASNRAFAQSVPPRLKLPYSVCLGPGDDEYCAFYTNQSGGLHYSMNYPKNKILNPVVDHFLSVFKARPNDLPRSRLVVGGATAFLAITPSQAPIWQRQEQQSSQEGRRQGGWLGLSKLRGAAAEPSRQGVSFDAAMERYGGGGGGGRGGENKEKSGGDELETVEAALGHRHAWWVKLSDGTCLWDLGGMYAELEALLAQLGAGGNSIEHLALSPFSDKHYFLVHDGGQVKYSLPPKFVREVQPALDAYAASVSQSVRKQGLSREDGTAEGSSGGQPPPPPYSKTPLH